MNPGGSGAHNYLSSDDGAESLIIVGSPDITDNRRMPTPTREEFESRIAAAEARADAKFIAFEKAIGESMSAIQREMAEMKGELQTMRAEIAPLKGLKLTIVVTGIGTALSILAVFLAVLAFGGNMFDSGRETAKLAADTQTKAAQAQVETAAALSEIRAIIRDMKLPAPAAAPDTKSTPVPLSDLP